MPQELANHDCLVMVFGSVPENRWSFRRITLKSSWDVADDLAAGGLVEVLGGFAQAETSVQIVYPAGRSTPGRARALIDCSSNGFTRNIA